MAILIAKMSEEGNIQPRAEEERKMIQNIG